MFKGIANFASMLKQAHELSGKMGDMQGKMEEMQASLKKLRVEGTAGGGLVVIEASGQQVLTSCQIDPELLAGGDPEMLEALILSAANDALFRAKEAAATMMAGTMNMPGLSETLKKFGLGNGT